LCLLSVFATQGSCRYRCRKEGYSEAGEMLMRDRDRMVTFYQFPKEPWKHLRTTNVVESSFAALWLRNDAAKCYEKVENDTAVNWKMLMLAEQRFWKLNAPEKLMGVYLSLAKSRLFYQPKSDSRERLSVPDVYTPIDEASVRMVIISPLKRHRYIASAGI